MAKQLATKCFANLSTCQIFLLRDYDIFPENFIWAKEKSSINYIKYI